MGDRRGHDEGTIYKRPGRLRKDGTRGPEKYSAQLTFGAPDGSTQRATFYAKTRREVLDKLEAAKLSRSQGRLTGSARQSVAAYLAEWLKVIRPTVRQSTGVNYELAVKWLCRYLGDIRLDQLKPADIERCYALMQEDGDGKLSPRSVQLAHSILRPALRRAAQQGVIASNPCDVVKAPRVAKKEMRALTRQQVHTLFRATENDPLAALWTLLVTSGLRIGEALALKWSDVDLKAGTLTVTRSVQRITGHGLVVGEPKSASSRRTVYLLTVAVVDLWQHRKQQRVHRLVIGPEWHDNDLVFPSDRGTFLDPTNVHHRFERALQTAGLPALRLHDLRHTAATLALEEGMHPKIVQEMLGHSTYTLTMNTYSHVTPALHKEAMERMNRVYEEFAEDESADRLSS